MAATTGNAKALIGVIFIQWVAYAFFYLADAYLKIAPPMFKHLKNDDDESEEEGAVGIAPV